MAVLLKHKDKDTFVKHVIWVDGKVEFTSKPSEAKRYENDWFANAELDQLKHYCEMTYDEGGLAEDDNDVIPHLVVYFT